MDAEFARDFSPKSLKAVCQAMIEHNITTKIKVRNPATGEREERVKVLRHGLCRKVINHGSELTASVNRQLAAALPSRAGQCAVAVGPHPAR